MLNDFHHGRQIRHPQGSPCACIPDAPRNPYLLKVVQIGSDSSAVEGSDRCRARGVGLLEHTRVVSSCNNVSKQHSSCRLCWHRGCGAGGPQQVLQSRVGCRGPLATGLCRALLLLHCSQALQPAPCLMSQLCVVVYSGQCLQMDILQVSESLRPQIKARPDTTDNISAAAIKARCCHVHSEASSIVMKCANV